LHVQTFVSSAEQARMSATIDHLAPGHRVKVLRGFTDARGIAVPAEATGVIRMMDVDLKTMEFTIDWERDGKTERLTFSLAAKEGPRNGHMRDWLELGEFVALPRPAKPANALPPEPAAKEVRRPDERLAGFGGKQPQEEICLHELTVACDCGAEFYRSIYPAGRLGVHACLRCGAVTVTRQVGDDGRFTGDAWTAYWTVPTPQKVVDWLGRFPRVAMNYAGAPWRWAMAASLIRYPTLLYPADVRVADRDELLELESALREAQGPHTRADRLYSACGDIPAPPEELPKDFAGFGSVQRALALRPTSDIETLKAHANLLSPSCELAAALLVRRDDACETMMGWLRSHDEDEFGAGIAMLRDSRPIFLGPDDPRLAPELLKIMNGLPLGKLKDVPGRVESCLKLEAFLVAIADLNANSPAMIDGLDALAKKIGGRDKYVVEAVRIVINELNGIDNRPPEYR
jgi:hypothetical protein